MFEQLRTRAALSRLTEEEIYAQVLREIESGVRRDGLYAKAIAENNGNIAAANAAYIRLRVQSVRDEIEMASVLASAEEKATKQQQLENEQIAAAEETNRSAEHKEHIENNTKKYFLAYEQSPKHIALRKVFTVSGYVCGFIASVLFLQMVVGNQIEGGYFALFAFGGIASLIGFVKYSPTHAYVECPQCQAMNRVPANKVLNCRCGKCRFEFEIETKMPMRS